MGSKRKLKMDRERLKRLEKECISLNYFLVKFLGIRDNSVLSNQISHRDIKVLFPQLKRASFDDIVENPDLVYQGEVLLIEDSFGSVVPYYDSGYLNEDSEFYGEMVLDETTEDIPDIEEIDLPSLSNYELQNLLRLYKRNNMRSEVRKVTKELTLRKDSNHASGMSVHRVLKKERKNERFDY